MKRVLIYADSRGQHTPRGAEPHDVFALRLAAHPEIEATVFLCPMKWTTTTDFLELIDELGPENFDHIILNTGIVEWSPRPQPSAINDLYDNKAPLNLENRAINTREYARKVVNNKKKAFDSVFTEQAMLAHLNSDLGVEYEGQPTINMYSLEMAERSMIPRLQRLENLIFINSNRFVPGWEGDFTRGRPANIKITEQYSELFRNKLGEVTVLDLLQWSDDEIQKYTCDNIHFTRLGSDWIYDRLVERMSLKSVAPKSRGASLTEVAPTQNVFAPLGRPITTPQILTGEDRRRIRTEAGVDADEAIATLIIGLRLEDGSDAERINNLKLLLAWIDRIYRDLFDVLIVEQDTVSCIDKLGPLGPNVRTEFLYNPGAYNRGWGYNAAVKHFTKNNVVALLDTDVLTGGNFVEEILRCRSDVLFASPYSNIYYTKPDEVEALAQNMTLDGLRRNAGVRKPTTITGGILIARREAYLALLGYEQYTSYGGEDRSFDVAITAKCARDEYHVAKFCYPHLFHPSTDLDMGELDKVLTHLSENYGCFVDMGLKADDDIHMNCGHMDAAKIDRNLKERASAFGDLELYRSERPLTVNGAFADDPARKPPELIFPPSFTGLKDYPAREIYDAPDPDRAEIAKLHNRFRGERCFIIGNGPSLNKHDLSLLKNEHVFAVNSFFYKTDETGFRPTFYVVEDTSVMKENIERIRAYQAPYKFFPTNYKNLHPKDENVVFFEMNRGFYEKSSPNFCVPRFSTDASKVLYCGQSVTYINLQLAYFLGFTEVYLIGMDFDYVIPKEHKRNGDIILSTTDDPNHFHKDYFGKGKTWKDPKLDRVAMNYREAKLAYESVGRRIYNATIGGKLEIFERVDYDLLLRTPEKREKPPFELRNSRRSPADGKTAAPLISVIVAAYNVERYLRECLDSLAAQDDSNFEVLIVDDGSTDGTAAIINEYCAKFANFSSIWQENRGLGGARNSGVEAVNGEFVLFIDSDDYISADAIALLRREQSKGGHDIVSGRFVRVSEDGAPQPIKTHELPQHAIPAECPALSEYEKTLGAFAPSVACARMIRKSLLVDNNLHFPDRLPHEDLYFTFKALALANSSSAIEDEIYFYRQRADSISKSVSKEHIDTVFLQWSDAERFLAEQKARPLARALIARRTLFMIEGVRKRVADASDEMKRYFEKEMRERRIGLQALLSDFNQSKLSNSLVPLVAVGAIESLVSEKRLLAPFKSENVLFPHYDIDFDAYPARETVEITESERDVLAKFHNAYEGKRCFILGNGPSLNKHDLALLKNEYTFAVNSFFYKTNETGFRPTFFVVEDNLVMKENLEDIKSYEAPFKFFPANYKDLHPAADNVFFLPANWGFYLQSNPNYCVPRFSTDASKEIFCGQTVTYINMQLAYFMGFTEVYLIGMDFNYTIPKEHDRTGNWIKSTTDDPNHFHKDYFGKGKTWKDPKLDRVANSYRQAKIAYEAVGRKIQNATIGGHLDVFERVDYLSLFGLGEERKRRTLTPIKGATAKAKVKRPFYAQFGEWLFELSPRLFAGARFVRRALAGLWRRRIWTAPVLLLVLTIGAAGFLPAFADLRGWLWGASTIGALGFAVLYLALRVFQVATSLSAQAASLFQQTTTLKKNFNKERTARIASEKSLRAAIGEEQRRRNEFANRTLKERTARIASEKSLRAAIGEEQRRRNEFANRTLAELRSLRSEANDARAVAHDVEHSLGAALDKFGDTEKDLRTIISNHAIRVTRLRDRVATAERQIGALRYPDAPSTFVFFGHHKCASRYFRGEVFRIVAEATGAQIREYKVKNPPFHYSRGDDLDLCNINFSGLGANGHDVVLFGNASERSLERIRRETDDWKGLRILRDPRQVLVSDYFHHKGNHHAELHGWVWDALVESKPVLREMPEEEGILHELDHISKDVIENQVLAPFDDDRVMTVRIEDFAQDPRGYLQKISNFLQVPDIAGIDFGRTWANPDSGKWRNHFTSRIRDVFKERYGQALIDLGYEKDLDW